MHNHLVVFLFRGVVNKSKVINNLLKQIILK